MSRKNNFDFLRLLFAVFVIVTHSYIFSGSKESDYLCFISKCNLTFASLGVQGFFVISGYLIFQSFERSKDIIDYFWKRILRLFPALLFVLLLTIVLIPFVYENKNTPYLFNKDVWTYIPRNITLLKMQYTID
ncbi:acyltransferase family protein, partial [Flavobacterium sp.]|uniref:acyltransferase family protein n=1 Tax=Flavobacterium sp. TaxID=239 RepID=UPI00374CC61D